MAKLGDVKVRDRNLREHVSDVVAFWNLGKIGFTVIAAEPTDDPNDAEIRLFDNGSVARIYVYAPVAGKWYKTDNLTSI